MAGERTTALEPSLFVAYAPKKSPAKKSDPSKGQPTKPSPAQGTSSPIPAKAPVPQSPSAAVEALSVETPGQVTHEVKKDDTIDALKKRLFPNLSEAERQAVKVTYADKPEKPVNPRKIQPGEKLAFTPPQAKVAEKPPAEPAFTPPTISAAFEKKLAEVAKKQGFDEKAFAEKITAMATKYKMDPNALLAVINCETGGTFSPSEKNPSNGATGLIQFTKTTAKTLGTSTEALAKMSAVAQLDYVDKYLGSVLKEPYKPLSDTDVYLSVFFPGKLGQGHNPNAVIFSQKKRPVAYRLNKSLDTLDAQGKPGADGVITSAEILKRLKLWYPEE